MTESNHSPEIMKRIRSSRFCTQDPRRAFRTRKISGSVNTALDYGPAALSGKAAFKPTKEFHTARHRSEALSTEAVSTTWTSLAFYGFAGDFEGTRDARVFCR